MSTRHGWSRIERLAARGAIAGLMPACSGGPRDSVSAASQPSEHAATVAMSSAGTGIAVLPSGSTWILVRTRDSWHTLVNVTPEAVPTGGGLAVATAGSLTAVRVGPYDRLLTSPILTRCSAGSPAARAASSSRAHRVAGGGVRL